ncbi:MAG: hypothetical protein L0Y72_30350 [Gemmataceae bacterium]|nr:hypothetical protein [Gemmataceae bacterium]MCI0743349.1 hypothetical protein [Gemmataceae bacterium]
MSISESAIENTAQKAPTTALEEVPCDGLAIGPAPPTSTRRNLLEIITDPQSIQYLLAAGGLLFVVGIVIWLTSLGVFENPVTVAAAMGLGNGLLLAGGWAVIQFTRYQTAGRALTLLACLLMPLHLWFYHANDLITLQGPLWAAALVVCLLYAASAVMLRDAMFAYVFCGGVALTGLLFLGDFDKLHEILSPATLLVVLGLAALHAERVFPEGQGPFTRNEFGRAFFFSAQGLLAAGLGLLLGGQVLGWLQVPFEFGPPAVVEHQYLPWTILVTVAGTYAYLYSDLVVRRHGIYVHAAALTLLWAQLQWLVLLDVSDFVPAVLIAFSITALVANVFFAQWGETHGHVRSLPFLAFALNALPVVFGALLHSRATDAVLGEIWPHALSWAQIGAMAVAALCCRAGAFLVRQTHPLLSTCYFLATAAATLVAAAGLGWQLGCRTWDTQLPWLMLIPLAYLVAARLYAGRSPAKPLALAAHSAAAFELLLSTAAAFPIVEERLQPLSGVTANLHLVAVCLEAALFYALGARFRKTRWAVFAAAAMVCAAMTQSLLFQQAPQGHWPVAFAGVGIVLLMVSRIASRASADADLMTGAAAQSANLILSLAFVAGAFIGLSRAVLTDQQLGLLGGDWRSALGDLAVVQTALVALALLAIWLVRHAGWRRWYALLALANGALLMLALHRLSLLSPWQKLELFAVAAGAVLLCIGHAGWYREQQDDQRNDLVSHSLLFGSLLAVVPLVVAVVYHRFGETISRLDEFGLVFVSVLLLGSGLVCRLRATTLVGGAALAAYLVLILAYMQRLVHEQVIVGIYLTAAGGLLFGTGLALSLYRDRILQLPGKIKRGEGIFKVLNWR